MFGQNGIRLNSPEALPSLTLINKGGITYLIDNCGFIVNQWELRANLPHPKLLPNGNIMALDNNGILIFEMDWEGNVVEQTIANLEAGERLIYELVKLTNGNYLAVGRKNLDIDEFYAIGYDPDNVANNGERPREIDMVYEIEYGTGAIVWQWNMGDHVIQERDTNAPNYGILKNHPELVNIDAISDFDWRTDESFMINSFDYNPTLDQIVLSIRKMSEIMVIDHSTTTAEAAGHDGGNSGKGGDILYRWGNSENYNSGDASNRFLYFQHNPNWITHGEHEGKIITYDNGFSRAGNYSTIPIISPPIDANGNYIKDIGIAFEPANPEIILESLIDDNLFSSYTSGVRLLENGNYFITEGETAELKEVTFEGELVWEFKVPNSAFIYRTEKYPLDYPGFIGKDLTPTSDRIPDVNSNYNCTLFTTGVQENNLEEVLVHYITNKGMLNIKNANSKNLYYQLFDNQGRLLIQENNSLIEHRINIQNYPAGFFILSIIDGEGRRLHKKISKL
jgi:hypothetical protein